VTVRCADWPCSRRQMTGLPWGSPVISRGRGSQAAEQVA
jgi:hypothetical protein